MSASPRSALHFEVRQQGRSAIRYGVRQQGRSARLLKVHKPSLHVWCKSFVAAASMTPQQEGMTPQQEGRTHQQEGRTPQKEGVPRQQGGTAPQREGITTQHESVPHQQGGTTAKQGGTTAKQEGSPAQESEKQHSKAEVEAQEWVEGAVMDAISAAASKFGTSEANMVAQLRLLATLLPGLPPLFDIFKSIDQDLELVEILLRDMAYLITRGRSRGREFDLSQKLRSLISKTERHFPYWVDDARSVMTQSSLLLNSAKKAMVDSKVSGTHTVPDSVSHICGRAVQRVQRSRRDHRSYLASSFSQLLGHLYCIPGEVAAQKIVLLRFCLRGDLIHLLIRYPSLLAVDVETLQRQVDVPPSLPPKTPGSMTNHRVPGLGVGTYDTDVNESVLYELIPDDFPDEW